jgi:hypothetical protein
MAQGYIVALHQITMGKAVPEVQSAMAMSVIAIVDDLRKGMWRLGK